MTLLSDPPLETQRHATEPPSSKPWLILGLGLCLLVGLCWGGNRVYRHWEERNLMGQAHRAFERNELRWAAMAAQRAFAVDSSSLDACRVLAAINERQKNPKALDWRRRALALQPDSLGDRLALVESALLFEQPAVAAETLAQVPPAQRSDARYQSTAAHLAEAKNDFAAAEKHLRAAVELLPNDPGKALELAEFQLRSGDEAEEKEGRDLAERLRSNPKLRLAALHLLLNDALRRGHDSVALELARELDALPEAPFPDRLFVLDLLDRVKDPGLDGALIRLEKESIQSPEKAVGLINWLSSHDLTTAAIVWSRELSPEMLSSVPLRFALANAQLQAGDWCALEAMLQGGSWGHAESLRLALEAKVARETGDEAGFENDWVKAVAQAENDPERLNLLQMVAFQWGWTDKAKAVLWMLSGIPETRRDALQALCRDYAAERDSNGLYRTLSRLVAVMPDDPAVRNNFSQIALLLKTEISRAREIAQVLHKDHPRDAAFASTYAFALFESGDTNGALKIMNGLTSDQLREPSVAAYYGVLLLSNGQADKAASYLDLGEKAPLLPEEQDLVAHAKASLALQ